MGTYIVRRVIQGLMVLAGALVISFVILRLIPGDPAVLMLSDMATPDDIARMRITLGVNQPVWMQFAIYVQQICTGDFGISYRRDTPALSLVLGYLPATLELAAAALLLTIVIAIPFGVVAALRRDSWIDHALTLSALFGQSVPVFWLGILLILVIADEPTTALDVTIQAQILELIARLQRDLGMAVLLITHDLGVVAGIADRVNVMYAGRVIENGPTRNVFKAPRNPYTIGLLQSVPRLDEPRRRLTPIRGTPPDLIDLPPRCAFLPRYCYAEPICSDGTPPLRPVAPDQQAACRLDVQAPWMTR